MSDQIGTFQTVIDGIILVLNAFAVIALLALTGVILLLQSTRGEVKATSPAPTLHAVASQPVGATATLASTLPPAPTAPAGDGAQSAATATLAPIATPDPSPIASQTAGAPKQPAGSFPPIVLLAPVGNITIEGDAERTFTWDWSGRLQADQGSQVLLWKDQTQPETAAEPVTTKTGSSWQQMKIMLRHWSQTICRLTCWQLRALRTCPAITPAVRRNPLSVSLSIPSTSSVTIGQTPVAKFSSTPCCS